jgi:cold shock CspA family protein
MPIGTVTRILKESGFGFIKDQKTKQEYFFHRTMVNRENGNKPFIEFKEGERVEYELGEDIGKGLRASYVKAF